MLKRGGGGRRRIRGDPKIDKMNSAIIIKVTEERRAVTDGIQFLNAIIIRLVLPPPLKTRSSMPVKLLGFHIIGIH